jgi:biopolymer transport protein ExbD
MKLKQDAPAPDVRIEIVPLIDVIFCILTFFILAALGLTRQQAINTGDLPSAATGVSQMRQTMQVTVDQFGQTYIDKQPVTRDQLYQALLDYQQTNPEGLMVLNSPGSNSYNTVVEVLDLMRSVGGDRVALGTLPKEVQETAPAVPGTPNLNGQDPTLIDPFAVPGSGLPGSDFPGSSVPGAADPYNPYQDLFPNSQQLPTQPSQPLPTQPGAGSAQPGAKPPVGAPPAAQD